MIKLLLAAAMLTPTTQMPSPAPAHPCVTRDEMADLMLKLLPMTIDGAVTKCRPQLPASSYLISQGPGFAQRVRADSAGVDDRVRAMLEKLARKPVKSNSVAAAMDDLQQTVEHSIIGDMKPKTCSGLGELVRAMSGISTEQLGRLLGVAFLLAAVGGKPDPNFQICPLEPS